MKKTIKRTPVTVTVCRGYGQDEKYISIEIRHSPQQRIKVEMSQEAFAEALFGTASVPAEHVEVERVDA